MFENEDLELEHRYKQAVDDVLTNDIPAYYIEASYESGQIIKKHPDGRKEYVTFDWMTKQERAMEPVLDDYKARCA